MQQAQPALPETEQVPKTQLNCPKSLKNHFWQQNQKETVTKLSKD